METFTAIEKINSTQNLSMEDFENGNINLNDVMEEVKYLQDNISLIRQQMTAFLTGLATLDSGVKPQQIFEENVQRVTELQRTLDDYVDRYKKLKPLLELATKELDLKVPERQISSIKPPTPTPTQITTTTTTTTKKQAAPRKRAYNKKNSVGSNSAGTTPIVSNGGGFPSENMNYMNNGIRTTESGPGAGSGSESQPILL